MWSAIATIAAAALGLVSKLWGGGADKTSEKLGQLEQRDADSKADMDTVRAANAAAKKVEQEETADDPNDLDARR